MKRVNKRGVSLAELLAVVVIMGIIAAIAIPLVGNVIETAKRKAFFGDLVSVVEAARTYCETEGKPDVDTNICYVKSDLVDKEGPEGPHQNEPNGLPENGSSSGNEINEVNAPNFEKYLSKPLSDISEHVYIATNGEIYYIRTVSAANKYTTTRGDIASRSLNGGALVGRSEEWFINVGFDNAMSFVGIAAGE